MHPVHKESNSSCIYVIIILSSSSSSILEMSLQQHWPSYYVTHPVKTRLWMCCKMVVACIDTLTRWCGYDYMTFCVIWPVPFICIFWQLPSPPPPPPVCFPPYTASRFPQCTANITTKMADAMEEYEKEAGCVPILHAEVWSLDFASSFTRFNVGKTRQAAACSGGCVILSCFRGNRGAPCKTTGGGWQVA